MNGMYRGLTSEGVEVFGWLNESHDNFDGIFYHITPRGTALTYKVTFASLAMYTGMKAKGKDIYGSFWIGEELTGGGDKVSITRLDNGEKEIAVVEWSRDDCGFCFSVGSERRYVYRAGEEMLPEIIEGGE